MIISCTAYPKSGVTWLIHLLSDLLKSPQAGRDMPDPTYWGPNCDGSHELRKRHAQAHHGFPEGKIVLLLRDPRDVAVSATFYLGSTDVMSQMRTMFNETYEQWNRHWLASNRYNVLTRYELLHQNPIEELRRIVLLLTGEVLSSEYIQACVNRQNFNNMIKQFKGDRHFMRKGIIGDWRNHFTRKIADEFNWELGEFMIELGYIKDYDWAKEL